MIGREPIGPLGGARKGREGGREWATPRQQSRERCGGAARREESPVWADEVPRIEPRAGRDRREQLRPLFALDRNRPQALRAIPREDLVERPLAESAVLVVEHHGLGFEHARDGSLARVFDHVGIAVTDLAASERFYRTVLSVLGAEPGHADAELVEWEDWDIGSTDREHPVTRGLHVGFRAPSREAVSAFWRAGIDAGFRNDGGFLLDPDGNGVEAVHTERDEPVAAGCIDHLWIRVRDPAASRRFYSTIAPHAGLRIGVDEPDHVRMIGDNFGFSLIRDGRPLTEHVHLAFPAPNDATVRAFHAAALAAGYADHGGPGERAVYHPGYYGAFVLDPDGHNVEVVNHNR
jgi:catechol 2,3-dioxygenase-like lactoylglutathione lyase family enzyme